MSSLTQAKLKESLLYDAATGLFSWRVKPNRNIKIGATAGCKKDGYVQIRLDKKSYLAHRLAWLYVHGVTPDEFVDHIDGDKSNNRITNLRPATMSQNRQNIRSATKNSKTGVKGVCLFRDKFRSSITIGSRYIFLGDYNTIHEAASAYSVAQKIHHPYRPVQTAGY